MPSVFPPISCVLVLQRQECWQSEALNHSSPSDSFHWWKHLRIQKSARENMMSSGADQICTLWAVTSLTAVTSSNSSAKTWKHARNRTAHLHACESGRICKMLIKLHCHSKQVIFWDALSSAWPPSHYQNKVSHPFLLPLFQLWLRGNWMHSAGTLLFPDL